MKIETRIKSQTQTQINITPQYIYQNIFEFPNDSLTIIWEFIEFMKYKKQDASSATPSIKLGGLLRDYNVDITENDIAQARR